MAPLNNSFLGSRVDSSNTVLAQAFKGIPANHLVDIVVAQCQQLTRGSQLEDVATLLEAAFAAHQLDQNALDRLYTSFLTGFQRIEIVDPTAKSIAESILSLFLANNDRLLTSFLDRLSETMLSQANDDPSSPTTKGADAPPTFIHDASDALALGLRLVPSLNSIAVSTTFLSHTVSGLASFDRDIRAAAMKLLPVVIHSLQVMDKWSLTELDTVYVLLTTLRSSPILLPDFAQLLSILLPIVLSPASSTAGLARIVSDASVMQGLLASLTLTEPSSRKFAIHCLHQIVDAIQALPPKSFTEFATRCNASPHFPLLAPVSRFTTAWNDFFLAYDLVAESYLHLLKTCFPLLTRNLAASSAAVATTLPTQWWLAVLERGFINDSLASRKMVLNYILSASDPAVVHALISHRAFLDSLVAACEPAVLYQVNVQGAFVSPFGESVTRFWSRAVVANHELVAFLVAKLKTTRAHVWLLFGVYGLAQAARAGKLQLAGGQPAVQSVLQLIQNTSPISNHSRRLVEQLVLDVILLAGGAAGKHSVDTVFLVCSYLSYFDHPQLVPWIQTLDPCDALVDRMLNLTSSPRALSMAVRESKSLSFIYHALADAQSKSRVRQAITDVINQVYTHPYLAQGIPEQRIALAMALDDAELTAAVGANVASYLMMQLDRMASAEVLEFFLDFVPVFAVYVDPGVVVGQVQRVLARVDDGSIEVQLAKVLAMRLTEHMCGAGGARAGIEAEMVQAASISRPASAQVHWNDLVTKFVMLKWNCLVQLHTLDSDALAAADLTDQLLDELESDHREGSVPLIRAAAQLIAPTDASRFARALGICWSMVVTSVPKHFNVLYLAFLDLLLAPKYVTEESLQPVIEAYMRKVIEIGSTKFSVVPMAAERMYRTLDGDDGLAFRFRKTVVQWIMYGPARDRDEERLETVWLRKLGSEIGANTDYSVRVLGTALAAQLAPHPDFGPALYSLLMQTFFSAALNPPLEFPNQQPNRAKLRLLSVILIMTPYAVSPTTAPDYFTSVLRIFDGEPSSNIRPYCEWLLALLALHNLDAILPIVFDALQQYNGRPVKITSVLFVAAYLVRALYEWSPKLGASSAATTGYATSIRTAAIAQAHLLDLVQSIFRSVTCWLASNHFTIRLHTQWLLERAWTVCATLGAPGSPAAAAAVWAALTANPAHQSLHACLTTNKDCVKFKAKYLDPGYMTNDFHPVRDLSVEFVFHLLPRIVPDNAPDEHVSSRAFAHVQGVIERTVPLVAQGRHMLLKHEHVEDLVYDPAGGDFVAEQVTGVVTAAPAGERIKASEEPLDREGKGKGGGRGKRSKNSEPLPPVKHLPVVEMPKAQEFTDVIETSLAAALPVQRKINPWAAMLQADVAAAAPADAADMSDSSSRLAAMQAAVRTLGARGRLDLVVCASLVELNTNLGGLARTCEIFGLQGLTVHSANILADPLFRTLAVSADRHLPIEQVARGEPLVEWLREMRRRHYVIVALEQTSASVSLEKVARFPEKMVLLLGKEKEGVPGELLAEVDMCIEIPQLGVTRSLNVHNAACTICWEYVRRRLVD